MKKNFFSLSFSWLFIVYAHVITATRKTTQTENHAISEVKSVFINGDSIYYIDIGKGEPVVFVHGAVGDYRTWGAQMDNFPKTTG